MKEKILMKIEDEDECNEGVSEGKDSMNMI